MATNSAPPQVATNGLQETTSFSTIICEPLKACERAQAMAVKNDWELIQKACLTKDLLIGENDELNVSFTFMQKGRLVQLDVPLSTIFPIQYISQHDIDINFKASISDCASSLSGNNENLNIKSLMNKDSRNTHKHTRKAGLNCPKCGAFIEASVLQLLVSNALECPSCGLKLEIDRLKSRTAFDALRKVRSATENLEKRNLQIDK